MEGRAVPLQLLFLAAVLGIALPAHTPISVTHHLPVLNESSNETTDESQLPDHSMATLPEVVTLATGLATHPTQGSKMHSEQPQLHGERRKRRPRKRDKRRKKKRRKRKRKGVSKRQKEKRKSTQTSSLSSPPKHHRARLLELLTKGNGHFFVQGATSTAGSRLLLPIEFVNDEALNWLPYNPEIRVSIQVIEENVDEKDTGVESHLDDSSSSQHKPEGIFPSVAETDVYKSKTYSDGIPSTIPNVITSTAKNGKNQPIRERKPDGKKERTNDKKGRGKHRRKILRENKDISQTDYKEWERREDNMRKEGKNEERKEGREKKGGKTKKGEEKQPRLPHDLVQELAEDLEHILRKDKQGTHEPPAPGDDPCTSWSTCRVETALQELAELPSLPTCPCLYPADLPYRHDLYDSLHRRSFRWIGVSGERERIDIYHRGAHSCIRSHVTTSSLAAQTCCYDRERKLLTRGSGAGSPALVSPQVNSALHWQVDVLPWLACRGNFLRYQAVRPPNNGQRCPINPNDNKYQQQVYVATDY